MRRVLLSNVLLALVLTGATGDARAAPATTGRLLVSLQRPPAGQASSAAARATAFAARARIRTDRPRSVPQIGLLTVRASAGESLRALARRLRAQPGVRAVQAEGRARLRALPDDPALITPETTLGTPAGITQQWWAERETLPRLWDRVAAVAPPLVAVIDSGVDGAHPELQGRVRSSHDLDTTPGHGGALIDEVGHGTHVASLACATAGNAIGIAGSGLSCGLEVIKSDFGDAGVARAIVTAADDGALALNMSFGTDDRAQAPQAIVDAIDYAFQRDVVMVAAASDLADPVRPVTEQGDPANVLQPAGSGPDITRGKGLSVTAAQLDGARAPFAGSGSEISIAAFGAFTPQSRLGPPGLLAAWPGNQTEIDRGDPGNGTGPCNCRTTVNGDMRYAYLQGTSIAAPQVTAVAALIRALNPDLTAGEVIRVLKESAARPTGGWTPDLGWGILDAGSAGDGAAKIDRRAPVSRITAPAMSRRRMVTVRLRSVDEGPAGVVHSGVKSVEIWAGPTVATARRAKTTNGSTVSVLLPRGKRSALFTRAIDNAGNREARPASPDVRTRISGSPGT